MSKWEKVKLKDICNIVSGTTPKSNIPEYWNGSYNWVTPAEITECTVFINETQRKITDAAIKSTSLKAFPAGTVLLSSRAPIGKVAIAGTEMYCNQGFKNLICFEQIYNKYLFWFLKGKSDYLNSLGRGATFKEISKTIVEKIEIPLPPLEVQHKIASILDTVSEVLKLRKQQLNELDLLVKSRFVEMFGELGKNPYNFDYISLGSCCKINPKKSEDNRLVSNLKLSFISMSSVSERGYIDTSNIRNYDEVKTGFTYFAENDVLFAKITPCMENGKGCIACELINGIGFGSTEFHVLRPIPKKSNSYWLYWLTIFEKFRNDAKQNMTGSAGQRRVPVSFLEDYLVALPPLDLQDKFATFVQHVDELKSEVQKSINETQTLFDSLMQRYFE